MVQALEPDSCGFKPQDCRLRTACSWPRTAASLNLFICEMGIMILTSDSLKQHIEIMQCLEQGQCSKEGNWYDDKYWPHQWLSAEPGDRCVM